MCKEMVQIPMLATVERAVIIPPSRGCSSMVERKLPKLQVGVRFPSPALKVSRCQQVTARLFSCLDKTLWRVVVSDALKQVTWLDCQNMSAQDSACTNLVQALVQVALKCRSQHRVLAR